MKDRECLNSLRVIGTILIFTPVIVALPAILYAVTTGKNVSLGDGSAGYAAGLMITAGLITLIYVSVKEFKKKLLLKNKIERILNEMLNKTIVISLIILSVALILSSVYNYEKFMPYIKYVEIFGYLFLLLFIFAILAVLRIVIYKIAGLLMSL